MPLRRAAALFTGLVLLAAPAAAQTLSADLRDAVQQWYRRAESRAPGDWGIAIGNLNGEVLWSAQPDRPLIPASTAKVFTTGFARERMGGDARRTTRVIGAGRVDPATGAWQGSWVLEMAGDPTLERPDRSGPTLRDLALGLRARGIRRLSGPLVLSSPSGAATAGFPAVWSPRFEGQLYAPPVGPVTVHENTVSFTVKAGRRPGDPLVFVSVLPAGADALVDNQAVTVTGTGGRVSLLQLPSGRWQLVGSLGLRSRPVGFSAVAHDPAAVVESAWAAALRSAGIRWDRNARVVRPAAPRLVLAEVHSAPLDTVASEVNRRSLNIGAELLLQWGAGNQTDGPGQVTRFVREVVGPFARIQMVDGSGLSELDRVSPLTQMLYLAKMPQRPGAQTFPLLLPANGTGTLRRLRRGLGSGVVHAKTGTLDQVAAVTGYLGRPDGVLVLSLMYNGRRTGAARQAQWELFRLLGADGVSVPSALETQMGGAPASDR